MTGGDMSQISPPMRILLIGSVVFLAAWFAFLRPGGSTDTATPPAPAPPATVQAPPSAKSAPGKAVESATSAAKAAEAADAKSAGESAPATTKPATRAAGGA